MRERILRLLRESGDDWSDVGGGCDLTLTPAESATLQANGVLQSGIWTLVDWHIDMAIDEVDVPTAPDYVQPI